MTRNNHGQADLQLLQAARQGCRDAQAQLLQRQQDTIYRFCLAQLGRPDAACEATQETAVRMLAGLPRFRGDSRLSTWTLGIALNVCREFGRTAQRHQGDQDGQEKVGLLAHSRETAPDAVLAQRDRAGQVHDRLHQLPPRQREALVLRYFEELTIEETAAVMGVSAGTVKATVFQALRNLRRWESWD